MYVVNNVESVSLSGLTASETRLIAAAIGRIEPDSVNDPEGLTRLYGQITDGMDDGARLLDMLAQQLRFA